MSHFRSKGRPLLILAALLGFMVFSYYWMGERPSPPQLSLPGKASQAEGKQLQHSLPPTTDPEDDGTTRARRAGILELPASMTVDALDPGLRLQFGTLKGVLYASDSQAIPQGRIVFIYSGDGQGPPRGPFSNSRTTLTNEHGEYEVKLSSGLWIIHFGGLAGEESMGFTRLGEFQVEANREQTFDLYVQGTRNFAGGFYYKGQDNILLKLDLRFQFDANFQMASADCYTAPEDYAEYLKAIAEENPDVLRKATSRPPGRGSFHISHLPAEVYEMRVYLDVKKTLFVSARIDLTQGDLMLDAIELTQADFFEQRVFQF